MTFEDIQYKLIDIKDYLQYVREENKGLIRFFIILILVLILCCFFIFPMIQENIRTAEVKSSYANEMILPDKLSLLPFKDRYQFIRKQTAITVVFVDPKNGMGGKFLSEFQDKTLLEQLNRKIYFFPVLYDGKEMKNRYRLNVDQNIVDILFFQQGVEKNRVEVSDHGAIDSQLVSKINALAVSKE